MKKKEEERRFELKCCLISCKAREMNECRWEDDDDHPLRHTLSMS